MKRKLEVVEVWNGGEGKGEGVRGRWTGIRGWEVVANWCEMNEEEEEVKSRIGGKGKEERKEDNKNKKREYKIGKVYDVGRRLIETDVRKYDLNI